ncbi:MAG: hypothetical protein GTN74_14195 [Proteobacteria bacterium]|nr:hypothetical protein [Pseudomonadota bacterium]NIS71681.1 hypothetical protein [Pseudomonadota bacterium]
MLSSLQRIFSEEDYQIQAALNGENALAVLSKERIDAALIDPKNAWHGRPLRTLDFNQFHYFCIKVVDFFLT